MSAKFPRGGGSRVFFGRQSKSTKGPIFCNNSVIIFALLSVDFSMVFWQWQNYRTFPKYSDTQKICCNHSKIWTMWLYHRAMSPNGADGMANSVDPDQTAPLGAVWSGSALFAQAYLSENSRSLLYCKNPKNSDTRKSCYNYHKLWTRLVYHKIMPPKDAYEMTKSVDFDHWSGSAIFVKTCLFENLGSLRCNRAWLLQ